LLGSVRTRPLCSLITLLLCARHGRAAGPPTHASSRSHHRSRRAAAADQGRACVCIGDRDRGQAVGGTRDARDRVAGADVTSASNAEVHAEAAGFVEPLHERGVAHPDAELEAREFRLRDLERHRSNRPHLADDRGCEVDTVDGEVLAERRRRDGRTELLGRPPVVAGRVRVDRLSGPPCTRRSAWRSPATLIPATATRPATGAFQIAVTTWRPIHSTVCGAPTFTDASVPIRSERSPAFTTRSDHSIAGRRRVCRCAVPRPSRDPATRRSSHRARPRRRRSR
jgi:hypothetical protein